MRRTLILAIATLTLMVLGTGLAAAKQPDHAGGPPDHAKGAPDRGAELDGEWEVGDHPSLAPKVDVCHVNGEGEFHLITISANALAAHVAHGDALAGDPVPGSDDYVFDEDCEIPAIQVVEGSYSDGDLTVDFNAFVAFDNEVTGMGYYTYTDGDRVMDVEVMDVCLDELAGTASVWGTGDPSWEPFDPGYMVLTLVDTVGDSMATRALLFDNETDAVAAFDSQCAIPVTGASGGTGYLNFL